MTRIPFLLAAAVLGAAPTASQDAFAAARFYADTESGKLRALVDADVDGDLDGVEIIGQPQSDWTGWEVHLSDGARHLSPGPSASFPEPPTSLVFFARHPPRIGDVTGDGIDDLVVERYANLPGGGGNPGFYVYRGDGAGGFLGPDLIGIPSAPGRFELGQIDGDPALEIVTRYSGIGQGPELGWFHWTPTGGVPANPLSLSAPADPGGGLWIPRVADLDGNGIDDVFGLSSDKLSIRVFPTMGGAPTYGTSITLPPAYQGGSVGFRSRDLDVDGDAEILAIRAINTFGAPQVAVLVFENTPGGFLQRPEIVLNLPSQAYFPIWDITFGDWDQDGDEEIVGVGYNAISLKNEGALDLSYGATGFLGGQTGEAGIGDVDADGFLDAVGENSALFGDGTFQDILLDSGEFLPPVLAAPLLLDFEDDGDLDVGGAAGGRVYLNDASGAWSFVDTATSLPPGITEFVSYGDFTGDGRGDWIAARFDVVGPFSSQFAEMVLLEDDGLGHLVGSGPVSPPATQIQVPSGEERIPVGDIEGDGDLDLLTRDGFWPNTGGPFFPLFVPSWNGDVLAVGDLEGDGDNDLVTDGSGSDVVLWRRIGSQLVPQILLTGLDKPAAHLVDLDEDGALDIVGGDSLVAPLSIWSLQGGVAVLVGTLDATVSRTPAIAVGDADGDGLGDLFTTRDSDTVLGLPTATVFRRTGPGIAYGPPDNFLTGAVQLFADFDGDGDLDALGAHLHEGQEHVEPASGHVRQYGAGVAGSAPVAPVLGVEGPVWVGASSEMRLRWGPGAGLGFLVLGLSEAALADTPLPGQTLYVGGPGVIGPLFLTGTAGVSGSGELDLVLPTDGFLAGAEIFFQVFTADPLDPLGRGHTNGLAIQFGS